MNKKISFVVASTLAILSGKASAYPYGDYGIFKPFERVQIKNKAQNMCLDATGTNGGKRADVVLWNCDGNLDQKWYIVPYSITSGYMSNLFQIKNAASNLCLDVRGDSAPLGGNVGIWDCERWVGDQLWYYEGGYIVNWGGYVLDPAKRDGHKGADVVIWNMERYDDQLWYVVK